MVRLFSAEINKLKFIMNEEQQVRSDPHAVPPNRNP